MLVIPIKKIEDFDRAQLLGDLVEFRLDLFEMVDLKKLKTFPLSEVIFTLRIKEQGGQFKGSEKERQTIIKSLLELNPGYFDLEADMDPHFIENVMKDHPKTTFIGSTHNFIETPLELPFDSRFPIFKMATLAQSTIDSLKVLKWIQEHRGRVAGMAMGEKGLITRVLGKPSGSVLSYAALDSENETAPGQISSKELKEIYRFDELNEKTTFYGVIGKPVNNSLGHLIHNNLMREKEINGVYVRMEVDPSELSLFLPLAKEVGFKGLSVTMPLKEAVVPFMQKLHEDVREIESVNTIKINDHFEGYNTDSYREGYDIHGLPMYIHQASIEDEIWFNIDREEAYNIIKKSLE